MLIRLITLLLVAIALGAAGCGSDSNDQATQAPVMSSPEAGTQANGGFPGAGNPTAPDVTTTPGKTAETSPGRAGGGSSTTCIGC